MAIAAGVAAGEPAWEPGTRHGYHGVTFGWLVGELVRRISGSSLGPVLRRGGGRRRSGRRVPSARRSPSSGSVATVMEFPVKPGQEGALAAIDPDVEVGPLGAGRGPREPLRRRAGAAPVRRLHEHAPRCCRPRSERSAPRRRRGGWPGSTPRWRRARSWCRGRRSSDFRVEQVCGRDAVMGVPTRWAVGYTLETPGARARRCLRMHGPIDGAFGHMGAGGQIGFADPTDRVAVGFVRNHLENQALPLMGACAGRRALLVPGRRRGRRQRCTQLTQAAQHPNEPALIIEPSGRDGDLVRLRGRGEPGGPLPARDRAARRATTSRIFMENDPRGAARRGGRGTDRGATTRRSTPTSRPRRWPTSSTTRKSRVVRDVGGQGRRRGATARTVPERRALGHGGSSRAPAAGPFESWDEAVGSRPDRRTSPTSSSVRR